MPSNCPGMTSDSKTPNNQLAAVRKSRLLSRIALSQICEHLVSQDARFTKVSVATIQSLENGRSASPRPSTALTLSTALQVEDPHSLFPEIDDGTREAKNKNKS